MTSLVTLMQKMNKKLITRTINSPLEPQFTMSIQYIFTPANLGKTNLFGMLYALHFISFNCHLVQVTLTIIFSPYWVENVLVWYV